MQHPYADNDPEEVPALDLDGQRLWLVLEPRPTRLWLALALAFVVGVGVGTVLTLLGLTVGWWLR